MLIDGVGWVPDEVLFGSNLQQQFIRPDGTVDQAALFAAQMAANQNYNPEGDPSLGANVDLGWSGLTDQYGNTGTIHFTPEELARTGGSPYIFPAHGGQGTAFVTTDPNELASWRDDQQTRMQQSAAQIAALIAGGTALTGGFGGGAAAGSSALPAGAEVAPNGLLTGSTAAAGGGVGTLSGAVPAVGASPGLTAGLGAGAAGAASAGSGAATTGATAGGLLSNPWLTGLNVGSAILGGVLADRAADAGVDASREAIAESKRQYDTTRGDLLPTIQLGQQSADQIKRYLGGDRSVFQDSPGRAYLLGEGQRAIDRYMASTGRFGSGARGLELTRHAVGLADQTEGAFVDRLLASAGLGTTGAASSANAGANHAANVSNNLQAGANSRASGYANISGAINGGISNLLLQRYLQAA